MNYTYALRGDGQKIAEIVPAAEQLRALEALLRTLDPQALTLSEKLLQLIPPRAFGYPRDRESFKAKTGITFDPMAAVESATTITLTQILHPERAERLIQYHARDPKNPGLAEVIDGVIAATWKRPRVGGLASETQRVVDTVALYQLMALAASETAAAQARAIALSTIWESRLQRVRGCGKARVSRCPNQYGRAGLFRVKFHRGCFVVIVDLCFGNPRHFFKRLFHSD